MKNINKENKIFPRNLTAKADYLVTGNPMNSRTESGVENCYPGLEFDQRNIDKYFFPGLLFEFHRDPIFGDEKLDIKQIQPVLRNIEANGNLIKNGLNESDAIYSDNNDENSLVFMWGIGLYQDDKTVTFEKFAPIEEDYKNGLNIWRIIRQIPSNYKTGILIGKLDLLKDESAFNEAKDLLKQGTNNKVVRRKDGSLFWAVLIDNRTKIIDEETGVINTDIIEPGGLTRSLCNPWQYDFRDCKCYYWAANKPDIVSSDDGKEQYLDFLRKKRNEYPEKPFNTEKEWLGQEITHVDMISNWEQLPVVINDKEVIYFKVMVIEKLKYLATIEHAVCIEYLYAYYTLDQTNVKPVSDEILKIAIDEMRHLRCVNDMLHILGEAPVIDRASNYGENFNSRPFSLDPLTREKLNWFIEVEKPSQSINVPGQIDGMYVKLHQAILDHRELFPQSEKLIELIKLIIDEGDGHFHRYEEMEAYLKPFFENQKEYLLKLNTEPLTELEKAYLKLSDFSYFLLLSGLQISFSIGDKSGGEFLQFAIKAMHSMDDFNRKLAINGRFPLFTLPDITQFSSPNLLDLINQAENEIQKIENEIEESQKAVVSSKKVLKGNIETSDLSDIAQTTISKQHSILSDMKTFIKNFKR